MANLHRNNKILQAGVLGNEWISLPRARLGKSLPPRWMDSNPEAAGWGRVTVVPRKARERQRGGLVSPLFTLERQVGD